MVSDPAQHPKYRYWKMQDWRLLGVLFRERDIMPYGGERSHFVFALKK
jgi:hypothetical protein